MEGSIPSQVIFYSIKSFKLEGADHDVGMLRIIFDMLLIEVVRNL